MEQIKEITYLFTFSVPRKNILSEKVEVYTPNALDQKLVDVCHTRWLERIDGMSIFEELFKSVYHYLHEMPATFQQRDLDQSRLTVEACY